MKHINNINDILIKPYVSEKTYSQLADDVYAFVVHPNATRAEVKKAIETIFESSKAKVEKVNIMNVRKDKKNMGKHRGYKAGYKKAIVFLKSGSIPVFGQEEQDDMTSTKKKPMKRHILTDDVVDVKTPILEAPKAVKAEAPKEVKAEAPKEAKKDIKKDVKKES